MRQMSVPPVPLLPSRMLSFSTMPTHPPLISCSLKSNSRKWLIIFSNKPNGRYLGVDRPHLSPECKTGGEIKGLTRDLRGAGLSPNARKGYQTGIRSYIYWASYIGATSWPATAELLKEWAANRIMGSAIAKQGQVKPDTFASYLSLAPLETLRMKLLLQGGIFLDDVHACMIDWWWMQAIYGCYIFCTPFVEVYHPWIFTPSMDERLRS